ncbi:MAG: hypothetical protein AAFN30_11380 [Actinomycetota bacterium]
MLDFMDMKRSGALQSGWSDSPAVAPDVLPVIYDDVRRAVDDQHLRLRHLRFAAGIAMAVAIGAAGLLLGEPPLSFPAEASLFFMLQVVGFAALVMLPVDLGRHELTLVSLRRFEPTVSADALARRLVGAGRVRIQANEPVLRSRRFFLRIALIALVCQVGLLALAQARLSFWI